MLAPAQLANLPAGRVVAFRRGMPPVIGRAEQAHRRRDVRTQLTGHEPWWVRLLAPLARRLARLRPHHQGPRPAARVAPSQDPAPRAHRRAREAHRRRPRRGRPHRTRHAQGPGPRTPLPVESAAWRPSRRRGVGSRPGPSDTRPRRSGRRRSRRCRASRSSRCTRRRTCPPTRTRRSACPASIRTPAACIRACTGAGCGRCASSRGSGRRRRPTSASATCSTMARRG